MFSDLLNLFGDGWYLSYIDSVRSAIEQNTTLTDAYTQLAYVPWHAVIACVVMVVFIVSLFKFMRAVLCKIL